ncbi:D-alanine--D-alanine ligase family protein [Alicyclobacillus shizuokensis]|uniref:D-alanine--D-alanine ligase family protein n=1 Tax=Alicyclobacillus shizuokensis TaxID=392014 RepID=UPI00082AD0DA|nr:D-alanine--D-alanine ligase family protein [Alicyclobacillus shizuokensis]MCL6626730.1 D-alanine--D-alanine ligase [Alicyclobacillus shizuokensis]
MTKRIRVGVVFGGKSGEHEVSLQSARSVMAALDKERYELVPIAIDKAGRWHGGERALAWLRGEVEAPVLAGQPQAPLLENRDGEPDEAIAGTGGLQAVPSAAVGRGGERVPEAVVGGIDVVFPVLHGSYGEDGTLQGMLEMLDLPYVGAGVLASAVGMDKVVMKALFASAGLPQVRYTHYLRSAWERDPELVLTDVEEKLGYPCFVKPANLGSSVGISKAKDRAGLERALREAAKYDRKIIVEAAVDAREVEVGVLGNEHPIASVPGEIVPCNEFYDYRAKYIDGKSMLIIPAELPAETVAELQRLAVRAFQAIDGGGLARVDFFIERGTNQVLVNEINTMPGFTEFSMYPKLWEASGISYRELIDRLVQLALERHADKRRNQTEFTLG